MILKYEKRTCPVCEKKYRPTHGAHIYCSDKCEEQSKKDFMEYEGTRKRADLKHFFGF